jgi:hypothetical protein
VIRNTVGPIRNCTTPSTGILGIISLVCIASGCLETEETYTLNPDGSGKVAYIRTLDPVGQSEPDEEAKKQVETILNQSVGVEAWRDVAYGFTEDKTAWFKGTAYFRDIERLRFPCDGPVFRPCMMCEPDGDLVVEITRHGSDGPKTPLQRLSPRELEARINGLRSQYSSGNSLFFGDGKALKQSAVRQTFVLRLPGQPAEVTNLTPWEGGSLRVKLDGGDILRAMNAVVADDGAMRRVVFAGENPVDGGPVFDALVHKRLLGQESPIRARVGGDLKALFDYEVEVTAAKQDYGQTLEKAGLVLHGPTSPDQPAEFKSARVAEIRFDQTNRRFRVDIECEFSREVAKVHLGEVYQIVASDGEMILPRVGWPRSFQPRFGWWSKKKLLLGFDFPPPTGKSTHLKEISGAVEYSLAAKAEEVDLDIRPLECGAEGRLGARITGTAGRPSSLDQLTLNLGLPRDAFQSLKFYDEQGKEHRVRTYAWEEGRHSATVTCILQEPMSDKGRIAAVVDQSFRTYVMPFRLTDVLLPARRPQ